MTPDTARHQTKEHNSFVCLAAIPFSQKQQSNASNHSPRIHTPRSHPTSTPTTHHLTSHHNHSKAHIQLHIRGLRMITNQTPAQLKYHILREASFNTRFENILYEAHLTAATTPCIHGSQSIFTCNYQRCAGLTYTPKHVK